MDRDRDDEIFDDDRYLKRVLMSLDLLADKRIDADTKYIAAITPDHNDIRKSWDQSPENMIPIPMPCSIFKDLNMAQCLIFGFVMNIFLLNGFEQYETTLPKLSKSVGMKNQETFSHLSVLIKKGFMKKKVMDKRMLLSISIPGDADKFIESYMGTKTVKMRDDEFFKSWDEID